MLNLFVKALLVQFQSSAPLDGNQRDKMPLVSVIVNCYNGSRFLREALDSIIAQTYTNWEIIFWDNQSTDNSAQIFKEYSDPRMHYFYSSIFTTLGQARNLAVNCSNGNWLAFLDCDDIWTPDRLLSQVEIIYTEDDKLGFIYGKALVISEECEDVSVWGKKQIKNSKINALSDLIEGDIFSELAKINFVPLLTALVRKDLYLAVGGVCSEYKQAEDYDLFVKISALKSVRAVQKIIAYYRIHKNNATHRNLEIGYKEARDVISKFLPDPRARVGMIYHHTYYSIHLILHGKIIYGICYLAKYGSFIVLVKLILKRVLKLLKSIVRI
jgi:glycosyltransferase involved in cell wall biosynthesis